MRINHVKFHISLHKYYRNMLSLLQHQLTDVMATIMASYTIRIYETQKKAILLKNGV